MIPGSGIIKCPIPLVMINLAETSRVIPVPAEVFRQRDLSPCGSTPVGVIAVNPGVVGTLAAENGSTGGVAGCRRAIRPAEEGSAAGQRPDVGSLVGTILTKERKVLDYQFMKLKP